jgi:hypothetical protein
VADADAAVRRGPASPVLLYKAARVYAIAATKVEADQRVSKPRPVMEGYQDNAVRLLQRALAALPVEKRAAFWQEQIQPDGAMASLRGHATYGQLQAEHGKKLAKPPLKNE